MDEADEGPSVRSSRRSPLERENIMISGPKPYPNVLLYSRPVASSSPPDITITGRESLQTGEMSKLTSLSEQARIYIACVGMREKLGRHYKPLILCVVCWSIWIPCSNPSSLDAFSKASFIFLVDGQCGPIWFIRSLGFSVRIEIIIIIRGVDSETRTERDLP